LNESQGVPFGFDSKEATGPAVLIVEPDDRRRARLCTAFAERSVPTFDVAQAFDAMNSLGRADFGAVVVREGKRRLSVRGLLQLALRSHPNIVLTVLSDHPREEVVKGLGIEVDTFRPNADATAIATDVAAKIDDGIQIDLDADTASLKIPREVSNVTPASQAPKPKPKRDPSKPAPADFRVEIDFEEPSVAADATIPNPRAPSFEEPTLGDKTKSMSQPPEVSIPHSAASSMPAPVDITSPGFRSLQALESEAAAFEGGDGGLGLLEVEQTAEFSAIEYPLLEGDLEGHAGCPLLITLSARELTGRLRVENGQGAGTIYFFRGDPVAADADDGELIREKARGVGVDLNGIVVEEGDDLVSLLADEGRIPLGKLHPLLLGFLRDRVFALAAQESGTYEFFEEDAFLKSVPMIRVNAFGMILDSRRRRTPPMDLLKMSGELEEKRVRPLPPLDLASHKLLPFTRDVDLAATIGVGLSFKSFLEMTGLDPMMGTLVVLAMEDARLVEVGGAEFGESTARIPLTLSNIRLSNDGFGGNTAEVLEPLANRRSRIDELDAEIGEATDPAAILGVPPGAGPVKIREAYNARMKTIGSLFLDESSDPVLKTKAVALNHRLRRAYRSLAQ
jgi:hypothetical protein